MKTIYSTDVLQSENKAGNKKYWQGHILTDGLNCYTQTSFWQELSGGGNSLVQFADPTLVLGKSIGRSNETTSEEQARSEMRSMVNRQRDKGYHLDGETTNALLLPMLANTLDKYKHNLEVLNKPQPMIDPNRIRDNTLSAINQDALGWVTKHTLSLQRKYDGCRCLFDGDIMWSRQGKPFIPFVYEHLKFDTKGYVVDGELILPPKGGIKYTFQQTMKAIKKYTRGTSTKLEYHVYDVATQGLSFVERYMILCDIVKNAPPGVKLVLTHLVQTEDQIKEYHKLFVSEGYEGTIIRVNSARYEIGHRSQNLLKFKDFVDEEFEIIDVTTATGGNHAGAIEFILKTPEGGTFRCGLIGSLDTRKEMANEKKDKYIGQKLIVKFQEKSEDNIPRFPVGLGIRDYDLQG